MARRVQLLRWHVTKPGRPAYRAAEQIVHEAVAPAVRDLKPIDGVESLYVSKRAGLEVWLTVFVLANQTQQIIQSVEQHLKGLCFTFNQVADPQQDQILADACVRFRACIDGMTRVALDLHTSSAFQNHQKALIQIGCTDRRDRATLEPFLLRASTMYQGISDADRFWASFSSNCLAGQNTDCGHWLYNIVLGLDWFEGQSPANVAQQVGLAWP